MTERAAPSARTRRLRRLTLVVACLIGAYLLSAVVTVLIYPTFYLRYERPDYENYPGLYCYERLDSSLDRHAVSCRF